MLSNCDCVRKTLRWGLSILIAIVIGLPAQAAQWNFDQLQPISDIRYPKTPAQVKISYRRLVDTRDGVNDYEAKIMAQYEIVAKMIETSYDVAKPKIIGSDENQWRVRLPGKFSINEGRPLPDYVVCIDKHNGRVTCSSAQDQAN